MNKKAYTKPELFCEEYELSVSIAATCTLGLHKTYTTSGDPSSCEYDMGGDKVFISENTDCVMKPDFDGDDIGFGILCYQTPIDGQLAFTS